jgi:two-component sensor histidine kinase
VKNTLATVQSIAMRTLRSAENPKQARIDFEARLLALSRAHDVLTRENWEGADLDVIVRQAIAPYSGRGEKRFMLSGGSVRLTPRVALALAMALQELATNAVKYGALSRDSGRVDIAWSVEGSQPPHLTLRWTENGGPPVTPPQRRGFGSRLIERSLARDLNGSVALEFAPSGLVCRIEAAMPRAGEPG